MLNVQQVRLRFAFAKLLVSASSISKGLRQMVFQDGQGCPWFRAATSLPANLQPKNVQGCIFLGEDVRGSTQKRRFVLCTNLVVRTPKDGRGISQKQVLEQNLYSTDVHGRTSVERYTDVQLLNSLFQKANGKGAATSCCT